MALHTADWTPLGKNVYYRYVQAPIMKNEGLWGTFGTF